MYKSFYLDNNKVVQVYEIGDIFYNNHILDFNSNHYINQYYKNINNTFDTFIKSLTKKELNYFFDSFEKEEYPFQLKDKIFKLSYYNLDNIIMNYNNIHYIYFEYLVHLFSIINKLIIYKDNIIIKSFDINKYDNTDLYFKHLFYRYNSKSIISYTIDYKDDIIYYKDNLIYYKNIILSINRNYKYKYSVKICFYKKPNIILSLKDINNNYILFSYKDINKTLYISNIVYKY